MNLLLTGGLNLNDPKVIPENKVCIAENVDFRQEGVVRSRNGRALVWSGVGTDLITQSEGVPYSIGSDIYRNGSALGFNISGVFSAKAGRLRDTTTEALFISANSGNFKVEGSSVSSWGITAPTAAPTLAEGGAGSLSGLYYYKYTYLRKVGSTVVAESNPSPESTGISVTSKWITVTCTASSDSQVTHIRVYRTFANETQNGNNHYFDFDITVPTTSGTTAKTDGQLGTLIDIDNDVLPSTSINSVVGPSTYNCMFVAYSNRIAFSRPGRPESFPATYYVEVGAPTEYVLLLVDWSGVIFGWTNDAIYMLQGTDPDTFLAVKTAATAGIAAKDAWCITEKGIAFLAPDGIRVFNGNVDTLISREEVDSIFRGEEVNGVNALNKTYISTCRMAYFNDKLFFGYPSGLSTTINKVLVFDMNKGKWSINDYGINLKSLFFDFDRFRLLGGDTNNKIWSLDVGDNDEGSSFTMKVRSRELLALPSFAPSSFRVDITNVSQESLQFKWMSGGSVTYTSTISDDNSKRRRKLPPTSFNDLQLEVEASVASRVSIGLVEVE